MAVPESMLNAIRTSAPTAKNPLGKLEDAPFSGDDGAGFATVMREVAPPSPSRTAEVKASEDPGAGNELPDLPGRRARFIGANRLPASDATLEEFAVEMGIDRSLARLLLTDTANDAVAEDLSLTDKSESAELAKSADPLEDATAPAPPPWFIMAAAEQPVAPMPSGTGAIEASIDAAESTLERAAVPLADEDLLLWRASVGRAEMATAASPQYKAVQNEAALSAVTNPEDLGAVAGSQLPVSSKSPAPPSGIIRLPRPSYVAPCESRQISSWPSGMPLAMWLNGCWPTPTGNCCATRPVACCSSKWPSPTIDPSS